MSVNWPMLRRGIRRLFARRHVDIRSLARREIVVCPSESTVVAPAIHDPESISKVTQLSPWRRWETESLLIRGGVIEHGASTAHEVDSVDIVDAFMYAGAAKAQPGYGDARLLYEDLGPIVQIDHAMLIASNAGSHYFGNFMQDDIPLALLAADHGGNPISVVNRGYPHEAGYRRLLGVEAGTLTRRAHVKRLTLYTDYAQNSLKEKRYMLLRAQLRRSLANATRARRSPRGIYIRRGRTGEPRELANEAEIERFLVAHDFRIIDAESMTPEEVGLSSLDSRIVVGVEGSQFAHGIYTAADDAVFLVLQPPTRLSMAYKEFTDRMGMGFAFLVGDPAGQAFKVPLGELERMLDRLGKWW